FFDVHATRGRSHENRPASLPIDNNSQIKFATNVESFFDKNLLDFAALGTGLRRDESHSDHLAGEIGSFIGSLRQLDAAAFSSSTGVNLRLHDNSAAEFVRNRAGFFLGISHFAPRNSHAITRKNFLPLVLVYFHMTSLESMTG